ncbi:hypothetical protein RvY_07112 [Ramazzottius varieornatus]|uniref:CDK5 regulatory subunit-associated protein 3 n=1 Tax=Ramazzottius varieornatus TaxID=947166 RepID=A0A1D1VAF7_RAMVA|nr:hypothetical protein RvY_07112 [Ramazzottius varieornatus]
MSAEETRHIPIDIHLGQLSDWLISRRHCAKEWHASLLKIREKLAASVYPKLLTDEATKSDLEKAGLPLVSSELNYLTCKQLLDLLSGKEAYNSKNMIGQYQNPVTKDLNDVVKQYEKENIHLAELAQMLYRKITYDVPFIKKEMTKLDQSSAEYSRKTTECLKSGGDFREQYRQECGTLGIQGENVREELLEGAKVLPALYENIARRSAILEYVCKYVEEFADVVHKGGWVEDQTGPKMFPLLRHLIKYGNQPYPPEDECTVLDSAANAAVMDTAPHTGVDVEDNEGSSQGSMEVNLNATVADHLSELNNSVNNGSIDFDLTETEDQPGEDINWDIDTGGLVIVAEGGGDSEKKNLLENPELRTQTVNELHEMLAFLQRRLDEQSTEHMASDLLNIQTGDSRLAVDGKKVEQMIHDVKEVLGLFEDHRLQSLCKLQDSNTFLERLTKQLEQKLVFCDRMEHRAEDFRIRRNEAMEERQKLGPELVKLINSAKEIQGFIEQDISKKYNDRRVTILGGAQSVSAN